MKIRILKLRKPALALSIFLGFMMILGTPAFSDTSSLGSGLEDSEAPVEQPDSSDTASQDSELDDSENLVDQPDSSLDSVSSEDGVSEEAAGGVYSNPQAVTASQVGSASFTYPIEVPPGRNGLQPDISLQYSSYNGNGWLGVGWEIDMGSISRSTRYGLDYTADEYVVDGADLVPRSDWGTDYYGAKIEGAFTKYEFVSGSNYWKATAKDGTKYYYGQTLASRQYDPDNINYIYKWCLDRVEDTNGNYMTVSYTDTANNEQIYPHQIFYTGNTNGLSPSKTVEFEIEDRTDIITSYKTKFLVTTSKRLKTVTVKTDSTTAYKYILDYENSIEHNGRSRLTQIKKVDPNDENNSLPPYIFNYLDGGDGTFEASSSLTLNGLSGGANRNNYLVFGDINGDGRQDFIKAYSPDDDEGVGQSTVTVYPYLAMSTGGFEAQEEISLGYCRVGDQAVDLGSTKMNVVLGDVNGDGCADIMSNGLGNQVHLRLSDGDGTFGVLETITIASDKKISGVFLADVDGDKMADLVSYNSSTAKFYSALSYGDGSFATQIETELPSGSGSWYTWSVQMQLADFSGDGKADILVTTEYYIYNPVNPGHGINLRIWYGDGNGEFSTNYVVYEGQWLDSLFQDYWTGEQTTSDVNGDGLADVAYLTPDSEGFILNTHLSTGTGVTSAVTTTGITSSRFAFADINDDGMADLIVGDYFYQSDGDGNFSSPIISGVPGSGDIFRQPLLADIDGNGRADYIYYNISERLSIDYSYAEGEDAADCVDLVENPFGGGTIISYDNSSEFDNNRIPFVVHPVTLLEVYADISDTNVPADATTEYDYSDAYYDYAERDFRGFGYVKQTNPDLTTTETTYIVSDAYKKGRPLSIVMKEQGQSTPFMETINNWGTRDIPDTSSVFVYLSYKDTTYEDNSSYLSTEAYIYDYDNGFPLEIRQSGTDADGNEVELITKSYVYQDVDSWTWRTIEEAVTGAATGLARETTYGYDSNGNMTDKIYGKTSGSSYAAIKYGHDAYGNVTSEWTNGFNDITTIEYETDTYTYPWRITNCLSQVTTKTWDYRFGKEDLVTDPNGNKADYAYDEFGRVINIANKDASDNVVGYSETDYTNYDQAAFPRYITTSTWESGDISTGSYIEKEEYLDGLNRTIKVVTDGISDSGAGTEVITTTEYDNMGRKYLVEGPYFSGNQGNGYYEETLYDKMGRVTDVESPNGEHGPIHIVYTYPNPFTTEITDPDGKKKTEKRDHLGRIIEVIEHAGDDVASPVLQTTGYEYNAAGDMTKVTNALNIDTDIEYDLRGLKASMDDPDMGEWFYTYYDNGNLWNQTDAKGDIITFGYDGLNRTVTKTYTINNSQETEATRDVTYTYDLAIKGIGQLYSVANTDVTTIYDEYDAMGRALSVSKTIAGDQERIIGTTYDESGKVLTITYPDGFVVTNTYYPGTGLLDEVTGTMSGNTVSYAECTGYEPTGKIKRIYHDYNGTETVYNYDPLSTRLMDLQTSGETSQGTVSVQDRAYSYTKAGDIAEITDYHNGPIYTYTYDNLHRLLNESNTGEVPFARAEELIFTYDDADKPNAVRNIEYNGTDYGFTYDANGNMKSGYDFTDPDDIVVRSIDWNADNMPVTVTRDSVQTFLTYDGDGARAKKVAGGTTTYYVSNDYEIKNDAATKYIFAGNLRVATIDDTNTYIFHKDHLGSSTAMTTYNDVSLEFEIEETTEYLPFGGMREQTGDEVSDYKFTDQERDRSTNLYNYDARLYDPIIGRFISADSIVPDRYDPQSLNKYTYCRNNPLIYEDPDGHFFGLVIGGLAAWAIIEHFVNPDEAAAPRDQVEAENAADSTSGFGNAFTGATIGVSATGALIKQGVKAGVTTLGKEVVEEVTGVPTDLGDISKIGKNLSKGADDIVDSVASKNVKSLTEQANDLVPLNNGKNRVTLQSPSQKMEVDLAGKEHGGVPTPHTKVSPRNPHAPNQPAYNTKSSPTVEATQQDIRTVRRYLERQNR